MHPAIAWRNKVARLRDPASFLSQEQLPIDLVAARTMGGKNRTTIPIKQYSNKFFREIENSERTPDQEPPRQQKRLNSLLKKKQILTKHTPRQQLTVKGDLAEPPEQQRFLAVSGLGPLQRRKGRRRAVTEGHSSLGLDNTESSIIELEQELIEVIENTSFVGVDKSQFFRHQQTEPMGKGKGKGASSAERGKISQSRGLELFSKLYIKERSFMVERMRESAKHLKRAIQRELCDENNFETRKIQPMEKNRKRQKLARHLSKKPGVGRTPMRLLQNEPFPGPMSNTSTLEHEPEDFFEINGWDTTL